MTDIPSIHPPEEKVEEPKLTMPDLSKGPASFFDTETMSFWIGIPVRNVDFITASVLLDRCKSDLLQVYARAAQETQKPKIVKPWAEIKEGFKRGVAKIIQ